MRTKLFLVSLFVALFAPVHADTFVNMTLTGNNLMSWGGEYVSPYEAKIGNSTILVACLDLTVNTYVGHSYAYDVTTPAAGDQTPFVNYQAAAILMSQILSASGDARGKLSFAIWDIFNDSGVVAYANNGNPTHLPVLQNLAAIQTLAANAVTQATTGIGIPSFTVYYPASTVPVGQTLASQRFISVPDGGMTLMLLGGALFGLETLRRKSHM